MTNTLTARELATTSYRLEALRKIGGKLHRLDEAQCNFGLTPRQEKTEARLEEEAQEIASMFGLDAFHQRDPRGCSLYLVDPGQTEQYTDGCPIL